MFFHSNKNIEKIPGGGKGNTEKIPGGGGGGKREIQE